MNKRIQTAHVFTMCFNVFDLVDTHFTALVFLAWVLYLDIALSCFSIQIYKDSKISKSYFMYTQSPHYAVSTKQHGFHLGGFWLMYALVGGF